MTSSELNETIGKLESDVIGFEAFGGKVVPYIGWFWRTVEFDRQGGYWFGVIPADTPEWTSDTGSTGTHRSGLLVGFMENNKWDYPIVRAEAEEWAAIKAALVKAVTSGQADDFRAANDLIQTLGAKKLVPTSYDEWGEHQ